MSCARILWKGNQPGSSIARKAITGLFFFRSVAFRRSPNRTIDCTILRNRTSSTPKPRNDFIVTKVMKNDDIRGNEFPSISKAASGFSTIIAIVSNIDPAMAVTKNTLRT
mmetsp:Transcript_24988/g.31480  ORF Transcript_24988/g.31480 Transcript_24988/m.31480 type:complete len:110 (-) Transcript_24988:473-802(-)